jgi:hypothetical protein
MRAAYRKGHCTSVQFTVKLPKYKYYYLCIEMERGKSNPIS